MDDLKALQDAYTASLAKADVAYNDAYKAEIAKGAFAADAQEIARKAVIAADEEADAALGALRLVRAKTNLSILLSTNSFSLEVQ